MFFREDIRARALVIKVLRRVYETDLEAAIASGCNHDWVAMITNTELLERRHVQFHT